MTIPSDYSVSVKTPQPVTVKIDISERTLMLGAFVTVVAAALVKKLKG